MNQTRSWVRGSLLAVAVIAGVVIGVAGRSATGQDARTIQTAVAQAKPVATWAVVQEFTGSLRDANGYFDAFMKEFSGQNLDDSLAGFEPAAILLLYDDPAGKPQVRMRLGLTVPARLRTKEPLRSQRVQFSEAVRTLQVGPYEQLGRARGQVATALERRGRGVKAAGWPVLLKLLNDPELVKPEAIRTELIVPVEVPDAALSGLVRAKVGPRVQQGLRSPKPFATWFVSQSFRGSMDQTGEFLDQFMKTFEEQRLGSNLAPDATPLAVLESRPEKGKEIKIEIGFPVKERVNAKNPLSSRQIQIPETVGVAHVGEFRELGHVYEVIVAEEKKAPPVRGKKLKASFPVILRLLTNPREVPPDANRTDLIVPLVPAG